MRRTSGAEPACRAFFLIAPTSLIDEDQFMISKATTEFAAALIAAALLASSDASAQISTTEPRSGAMQGGSSAPGQGQSTPGQGMSGSMQQMMERCRQMEQGNPAAMKGDMEKMRRECAEMMRMHGSESGQSGTTTQPKQ